MTSLYPYLAHPAHPKQFTDAAAVSLSRSRLRLRSLPFPFASPHWLEWLRALSAHGVTTLQVSLGQRPSLCDSSVSRAGPAIVCSHSARPCQGLVAARTAGSYVPLRHNPLNLLAADQNTGVMARPEKVGACLAPLWSFERPVGSRDPNTPPPGPDRSTPVAAGTGGARQAWSDP